MSAEDEQAKRLRRAFAARADEAKGEDAPADAESIWHAAAGDLPERETAALIDLAARSPEVAEAWRLAHAMRAQMQRRAEAPPAVAVPRPPAAVAWWSGVAAAAVAGLAVALFVLLPRTHPPEQPLYRAAEPRAIVALVPEDAFLEREHFELRWIPLEDERWTYRVRVFTESLVEIAQAGGVEGGSHRVPAEKLLAVESGSRLYWLVEAEHADGRRIDSPAFFVRVK